MKSRSKLDIAPTDYGSAIPLAPQVMGRAWPMALTVDRAYKGSDVIFSIKVDTGVSVVNAGYAMPVHHARDLYRALGEALISP